MRMPSHQSATAQEHEYTCCDSGGLAIRNRAERAPPKVAIPTTSRWRKPKTVNATHSHASGSPLRPATVAHHTHNSNLTSRVALPPQPEPIGVSSRIIHRLRILILSPRTGVADGSRRGGAISGGNRIGLRRRGHERILADSRPLRGRRLIERAAATGSARKALRPMREGARRERLGKQCA